MPADVIAMPTPLPAYGDPAALIGETADLLAPSHRLTVADAAHKFRMLRNPGGGYSGPWRNDLVPYMVEPMEMFTARRVRALIFVGPAQSAKTAALIENPLVHAVCVDPADMMIVQMNQDMARDFSKRRLSRLNHDCPEVQRRLSPSKSADNVFDKMYAGMLLSIGFPAISQLSSRPIPRMLFTDYDRMPEDVGGEGEPFDLGVVRTRTFGSRGITVAESSPGRPVTNAKWRRQSPHEAPPSTGILALYNRGDRRRFYWQCPHCGEWFEGNFSLLKWPEKEPDPKAAGAAAVMVCPHNGCVIEPKQKRQMNTDGVWCPDGCEVTGDGDVTGTPPDTSTVSYWLKGVAAAFISWPELVEKYLIALREFDRTGSEEALKTTVNTDQGEPYIPRAAAEESSLEAEELVARVEPYKLCTVPADVRFMTMAVDVQANRFDVLVRGWGKDLESWVIDRFQIWRPIDEDRPLDPARYVEDWAVLFELLDRRYPLQADKDRSMRVAAVAVDSAGAPGVTANAYDFFRQCEGKGLSRRLMLTKGASTRNAPRLRQTFPDAERKDRKAAARGEIPVWMFNPNGLKDELDQQLRRTETGPRFVHFSRELLADNSPHPFFEEITAEVRQPNGDWKKEKARNETLDLMVMTHAAGLALEIERIDWNSPPGWAADHGNNVLITDASGVSAAPAKATSRRRRVRSKGI